MATSPTPIGKFGKNWAWATKPMGHKARKHPRHVMSDDSSSTAMFRQIVDRLSEAIEGNVFGARCIKSSTGKTAAILWKNDMQFKLGEVACAHALKLDGARVGFHLYAPERPMKGWVFVPRKHADQWVSFAEQAIAHVERVAQVGNRE